MDCLQTWIYQHLRLALLWDQTKFELDLKMLLTVKVKSLNLCNIDLTLLVIDITNQHFDFSKFALDHHMTFTVKVKYFNLTKIAKTWPMKKTPYLIIKILFPAGRGYFFLVILKLNSASGRVPSCLPLS